MNKVILCGNVTKDCELNFTQGKGTPVLKFSMAVARGFKQEDGTDFINCTLFGTRAEKLSPYIVKGTKVLIDGALRINSYDKKDGTGKGYITEVLLNDIKLLGGKKTETSANGIAFDYVEDAGDDIPF